LTDQGIRTIKDFQNQYKEGLRLFEDLGGKPIGYYSTMGEYDYIGIGELPNDNAAVQFSLAVGSVGNVRTTTLKAMPYKEFEKLVKKLP